MSSIMPRGGWEPKPSQRIDSGIPFHPYTLERGSFVNDLSKMGGTKAGQISFGTVFGAITGFYLARLLVTVLKVGLVGVAIVGLIVIANMCKSSSRPEADAATAVSLARSMPAESPVFLGQNNIPISAENPYRDEGNYTGWTLARAERAHRKFLHDQLQWEQDRQRWEQDQQPLEPDKREAAPDTVLPVQPN